jgi:superfamily II DNA or RNA helicase
MTIQYVNALAGAGKTYALARHAHRLAGRGAKILFVQPTKTLIDHTIAHELEPLVPGYPFRAIHGDVSSDVVEEIMQHAKDAGQGGEILFITHAAFFKLPFFQNAGNWHVLMDECPQVVEHRELTLTDTHELLTTLVDMEPFDALYGLLRDRGRRP